MLKPLDDVSRVISLIAEVAETPPDAVRKKLLDEATEIGSNVYAGMIDGQIPMYKTSPALDEFYKESDAFLYETTVWNTCSAKQNMRDFVSSRMAKYGKTEADVFCFGDGLGFDSTFLASQGHRVRYFEPSLRCQDYAKAVFAANDVNVTTLNGLDDIEPASLDAVVCLDVLEHVPQPHELISLFSTWMKPDGLLFVHAPFWCLHWTRSTHLKENQTYSGDLKRMYAANNFRALDSSVFWDPILLQKTEAAFAGSIGASMRIRLGQFLLTLGRWDGSVHTWIARQIARPPKHWVAALKEARV